MFAPILFSSFAKLAHGGGVRSNRKGLGFAFHAEWATAEIKTKTAGATAELAKHGSPLTVTPVPWLGVDQGAPAGRAILTEDPPSGLDASQTSAAVPKAPIVEAVEQLSGVPEAEVLVSPNNPALVSSATTTLPAATPGLGHDTVRGARGSATAPFPTADPLADQVPGPRDTSKMLQPVDTQSSNSAATQAGKPQPDNAGTISEPPAGGSPTETDFAPRPEAVGSAAAGLLSAKIKVTTSAVLAAAQPVEAGTAKKATSAIRAGRPKESDAHDNSQTGHPAPIRTDDSDGGPARSTGPSAINADSGGKTEAHAADAKTVAMTQLNPGASLGGHTVLPAAPRTNPAPTEGTNTANSHLDEKAAQDPGKLAWTVASQPKSNAESDGGHAELRVNLRTEEMGRVELRTAVHDSHVTATVAVEDSRARGAVANELGQLHAALRAHELHLDQATVSATSGSSHASQGSFSGGGHRETAHPARSFATAVKPEDSETENEEEGTINVVV